MKVSLPHATMLTNHLYNLIEQLSQESQGAYRIDRYLKDSEDCSECKTFWQKLKADKEKYISDLSMLIQEHMQMQKETPEAKTKREPAYLAE